MGGAIGGLFSGVQGGIQGAKAGTGFGSGFKEGVTGALPGAQSAAQSAAQNTISDVAKSSDMMVAELAETQSESILARAAGTSLNASGAPVTAQEALTAGMRQPPVGIPSTVVTAAAPAPVVTGQMANLGAQQQAVMAGGAGAAGATPDQIVADMAQRQAAANAAQTQNELISQRVIPGFRDSVKDAFAPGGRNFAESMKDAFIPKRYTAKDFFSSPEAFANASAAAKEQAAKEALAYNTAAGMGPGIGGALRSYAPLVAAGTAVLALPVDSRLRSRTEMPFGGVPDKIFGTNPSYTAVAL